jgi:hypothetical protein
MCLLDVSGLECGPVVSPRTHINQTHKRRNPQVPENFMLQGQCILE